MSAGRCTFEPCAGVNASIPCCALCRASQLARTLETIGLTSAHASGIASRHGGALTLDSVLSPEQWSSLCESAFESGRADVLAAGLLEHKDGLNSLVHNMLGGFSPRIFLQARYQRRTRASSSAMCSLCGYGLEALSAPCSKR